MTIVRRHLHCIYLTFPTFRVVHSLGIKLYRARALDRGGSMIDYKRRLPSPELGQPATVRTKIGHYKQTAHCIPKKERKKKDLGDEEILVHSIERFVLEQGLSIDQVISDVKAHIAIPKGTPNPDHRIVETVIGATAPNGIGLGFIKDTTDRDRVVAVPYTLVSEKVKVKVYKVHEHYHEAELFEVVEPSPLRDPDLVKCKYFTKCSGCQYQMISYETQLAIKRQVIVDAYQHYISLLTKSEIPAAAIPQVDPTEPSPLQYRYRTKLTPHFDVPRSRRLTAPPNIGFGERGRKTVVDIEECPIGTAAINKGLAIERSKVHQDFGQYKKGVTILLREDFQEPEPKYTADTKSIVTEQIGKYKFQFGASSFFQNNNSILPAVTDYVKDRIRLPNGRPPTYLVDTYCGSGMFGITCSEHVELLIGVEISKEGVQAAQNNAKLNNLKNATFKLASAEEIFKSVECNPSETSVIIDPPRKGCDQAFLDQLLQFSPEKIVYVSCNVHTQARDVGYIIQSPNKYRLDSIKGFDFFPQTHHVESVAVLSRISHKNEPQPNPSM